MALEIWWGSGSPYSWRALLALEYKQLSYVSHLVQFAKQEHKGPALLKMNPRGRVPVLKDDDYVVFESLAILHYLDRKYPSSPLFGHGSMHVSRYSAPFSCANLMSAMLETSTDRFSRKSPRPSSGSSTWR